MNASEWLTKVRAAAEHTFPNLPLNVQIIRETRIKVGIKTGNDVFADLFFREETNRYDYSLIVADVRKFGLDNLGGWHKDPFDAPNSHIPINEPTPEEALHMLSEAVDKLSQ